MKLELYSGTGNRFLLAEAHQLLPEGPGLAEKWCAPGVLERDGVDGLLILQDPPNSSPRMTIFNRDGSRPEACGNGLRCVGWHLARKHGGEEFTVETDMGPRKVEVKVRRGPSASLLTDMGPVDIEPLSEPWPRVRGLRQAYRANLGNPHGVLLVDDERSLDAAAISLWMRAHKDFPEGLNLGLIAQREGNWHLRVHERGVGETQACGTGACAAAGALAQAGFIDPNGQTAIRMAGGPLEVTLVGAKRALLFGTATHVRTHSCSPGPQRGVS